MIEEIEKDSHALRSLFDVVLHDENDNLLSWTKGLVTSIDIPSFNFELSDQNSATTRGYNGWSLPDAISLVMYETTLHDLEKYLVDWAFGEKGIFDLDKATFRAADKESYLYRKVVIRTTTYDVNIQGHLKHAAISLSEMLDYYLDTVLDTLSDGKLNLKIREKAKATAKEFSMNYLQQNSVYKGFLYEHKQAIPIVDKATSFLNQVTTQVIERIPGLTLVAPKVRVPIVVPTPVMKVPAAPVGQVPSSGKVAVPTTKEPKNEEVIRTIMSVKESRVAYKKSISEVNNLLNNLPKAKAKEKATSTREFRVALQNYAVGTYSYDSGEPVTYQLSLPIRDFTKPEFN